MLQKPNSDKTKMKADLHFHPSHFDEPHITEWKIPTIKDIFKKAFKKNINLLTITSCSDYVTRDKRWKKLEKEYDHTFSLGIFCDGMLQSLEINPNMYMLNFSQDMHPTPEDILYYKLIITHGQEIVTDKGDINVLFAEKYIDLKPSEREFPKADFKYALNSAKDSGENVVITIPHPTWRNSLSEKELKELFEEGKIDALETFDSLLPQKYNTSAKNLAKKINIPGIAVSDGHRISDLGKSYIHFRHIGYNGLKDYYDNLAKGIKEAMRKEEFVTYEQSCPNISRGLYVLRGTEARLESRFSKP